MEQETASKVERFLQEQLLEEDAVLQAALDASGSADLVPHAVSPLQNAFLQILAKAVRAERILEIGTLGGYSTIWLARALGPQGVLVSLEIDPRSAAVARQNLERAGLSSVASVLVGPATESLDALIAEGVAPFDLIFIDADKPNNPAYLERSLKLSRPGTLIIGDNIVRDGAVADAASADPRVQGVREFIAMQGRAPRLTASALQTLSAKGYDGFSIALVE